MTVQLVLGGARSGKTSHALGIVDEIAQQEDLQKIYVATAQIFDPEMQDRVKRHQDERDETWMTLEAPLELSTIIRMHAQADRILLVDCLTLWLSNHMLAEHDLEVKRKDLIEAIQEAKGHLVFVSNEVGLSIVPDNKLGRQFRDESGWMNQQVASVSDIVTFVAAGLPLVMKDSR
ncbi:bifunctional adenosylcobinamide kinase/adenosylcobinamide-phosphate guanylyltransferase [Curvivirga sp.]|uniref:bifunctional adenosylcobinamide kinase/adenosylcobinamide-phosphate guanylyltransferase n=1 Tax=Curvivirga sp. TaxID=2856848 RepID=UPI003B595065